MLKRPYRYLRTWSVAAVAVAAGPAAGQMADPVPLTGGYQNSRPSPWPAARPANAYFQPAGEAAPAAVRRPAPAPRTAVYRGQVEIPLPPDPAVVPAGHNANATDVLTEGCTDCGRGTCVPGSGECYSCDAKTRAGRFLCALYESACCPDPCYDPKWTPISDAGFFTGAARPVTQTRFRGTVGRRLGAPDRAEYFWARADGNGKGPPPPGPSRGEPRLNWNQGSMYVEAAAGPIGVFTETTYRSISPTETGFAAGFGDMVVGTKTMLYDCELFQFSFQFATTLPLGNFRKGLGTGHLSLEPSILLGIKLTRDTYLQTQVAQWVPIGGDPEYAGSILHSHASLNHVLCRILPDVPLVGLLEVSALSFQDGAYTDAVNGPFQRAGENTYVTMGPGLRLSVCDKIDFGAGSAFAIGNRLGPQQEYRIEVRVRY